MQTAFADAFRRAALCLSLPGCSRRNCLLSRSQVRGNRRAQRIFYTGQGFETMRMAFKSGAAEAAGVEGERQNSKLFALVQVMHTTAPPTAHRLAPSLGGTAALSSVLIADSAALTARTSSPTRRRCRPSSRH